MIYKDYGKTLYSSSGYSDKMGVAPLSQRNAGVVSASQLAAHPATAGRPALTRREVGRVSLCLGHKRRRIRIPHMLNYF